MATENSNSAPKQKSSGSGWTNALTRKFGPLPFWAWALIGGVGIYIYRNYINPSTSTEAADESTSTDTQSPETAYAAGYEEGEEGVVGTDLSGQASDDSDLETALGNLTTQEGALASQIAALETASTATASSSKTPAPGTKLANGNIQGPVSSTKPAAKVGYTLKGTGNGNWVYVNNKNVKTAAGKIAAPSGHNKPAAKKGYTIKGLGNGKWEYVKNTPKKTTKKK